MANTLKPTYLSSKLFALLLAGLATQTVLVRGGPPIITDDPGTPDKGHYELNLGFEVEKTRDETAYAGPIIDFNYGLQDNMQLKLEVPWLTLDEDGQEQEDGLGNFETGLKWRFLDEEAAGASMSVYPQIEFNTVSSSRRKGLVDRGIDLILPMQIEKTIGDVTWNTEFGYVVREYHDNEWLYGIAAGYNLSDTLEVLAEINGSADQDFNDDELVFNFGLVKEVSESCAILASVGRSFRSSSSGEPELIAFFGLQINR